jgi:hypothetical protein
MTVANIKSEWSSGDLIFKDAAAGTNLFAFRTSTDGILMYDDAKLAFGDADDITLVWDGSNLVMASAAAASGWTIGASGKAINATIVGDLALTGATLLKGALGAGTNGTTFTVAADGSLAIATNMFTVSAAGAVNAKGAIAFGANLTEFTVSTAGAVAVASTLGVTGDFAVNTDYFAVTAATGDVAQKNIQADATGVTHTVTKARAAAACVANDVIWQLIASGMNSTPAQKTVLNVKALMTGVTAGAEAGAFTIEAVTGGAAIAEVFRVDGTGIVLPATVSRGIRIGSSASTAGSGVALDSTDFMGSGFFADDGGVALTNGTSIEGVMARCLITQAITGGIDVSATALHGSMWVRANYTGMGGMSGLWGQFSVPTGVSIDNSASSIADMAGGHFSMNIPSGATLAASSHAAGVSVGGNLGGTLTGEVAGFRVRDPSAGDWTYGLDLYGMGTPTADIRLCNGETISNVTDGKILLTATTVETSAALNVIGDLTVNTSKFSVTGATGKTTITHTSDSTSGSVNVEPFILSSTMTGPGGVGGRARFALDTNVALGGWANALKAITTFGAAGRVTGMGSAFCAEMVLSAGTTQGTYAPLESELNMATGASLGAATSFLYGDVGGTGAGEILDGAYLFELGPGCVIDTGHIVQASAKSAINATHAIKIRVAATTLYIPAHTSAAFGV